jgi:hypothetical protein
LGAAAEVESSLNSPLQFYRQTRSLQTEAIMPIKEW